MNENGKLAVAALAGFGVGYVYQTIRTAKFVLELKKGVEETKTVMTLTGDFMNWFESSLEDITDPEEFGRELTERLQFVAMSINTIMED